MLDFILAGITSKIGYLADSGINVIWLAPIYASPLANFGFDITDFRDVHPDYGTMQDLKNLIVAAKNVGIKVKFQDEPSIQRYTLLSIYNIFLFSFPILRKILEK